ncbi:MAG: acyltransferase [Myxococcales bacterium]|nr:acyltransferase [Myxococcales bacterium]
MRTAVGATAKLQIIHEGSWGAARLYENHNRWLEGCVRKDHRPLWLKRASAAYNQWWTQHFLCPQFDEVGAGLRIINPREVEVTGAGVRLGAHVHMMATHDRPIRFTSFPQGDHWGDIHVGDYSIILPGTRIASAERIRIGSNCMLATNTYVSDADWHDVYDRTDAPGSTAPVTLCDNVWLGDSAIVCKGVTIGENSVVGTGAVVSRDIPPNVVAVGNPAKPVKHLDTARGFRVRESLFTREQPYDEWLDGFERWVLHPNRFRIWLRSRLWPTRDL